MQQELEQLLAFHCGPTLAGIKAGSLVSCCHRRFPALEAQAEHYNFCFRSTGIHFEILHTSDRASLLFIYRPALLRQQLSLPLARTLLDRTGYPPEGDLDALIAHLRQRLCAQDGSFPHEIGLFLGYPAEDVEGFQLHQGAACKLCGQWKVYSDVERAKTLFHRYSSCRDALCRRISQGCTITQLFRRAG